MKKILLIAGSVGISAFVHATTINAPSSLIGVNALQGNDAYSWGISIPLANGQTVASAEIDFTGITLTASGNSAGTGTLFTDLLNSKTTGVTTVVEGDTTSDYWTTQFSGANITSIGSQLFKSVGTTFATLSYILTGSELTALNNYLTASGAFNIGIDPNCHYTVGGLSFSYTLSPSPKTTVPDEAVTALLVVIGLAGLEVFRRQLVPVKVKA
jgi:hypothetical protein